MYSGFFLKYFFFGYLVFRKGYLRIFFWIGLFKLILVS